MVLEGALWDSSLSLACTMRTLFWDSILHLGRLLLTTTIVKVVVATSMSQLQVNRGKNTLHGQT